MKRGWLLCGVLVGCLSYASGAFAWGDEGHEIVALIAEHYLDAPTRARMQALLAGDRSGLVTDTSIATEATWADRYRDSDRDAGGERYERTHRWHFIDLELDDPDLDYACYGHPALVGVPASAGPAEDCVVDKIEQFRAELADVRVAEDERRMALQFLLHLVGDLHQPLHAIDDHDEGGNAKRVFANHLRTASLHHYWDTEFVEALGDDPQQVAESLTASIRDADLKAWRAGSPADWAREAYAIGKARGYDALPPPSGRRRYRLSAGYVADAEASVRVQLSRAGVRLAMLLNRHLR